MTAGDAAEGSPRVAQHAAQAALRRLIRDVPDFPIPGVMFKDIGPLLADPAGLRAVACALTAAVREYGAEKVAAVEARGFLLAGPVAIAAGIGVIPVRKAGKLPGATLRIDYSLEYGTATLEIQDGVITPGERVLIIDDVLATGGTAAAASALLQRAGALPVGLAVLLELSALGGRMQVEPLTVHPLLVI